jgi:preprotein translocase subunit SecG
MDQNQDTSLFGMNLDPAGRAHLAEAARWAKFLAIVGFVICALILIIGVFFGSVFGTLMGQYQRTYNDDFATPAATGFGAMAAIMYILMAVVYFFPCLFMYRFATKMKTALAANDQEALNTSFQNLKATFRFIGILTLIWLLFVALAFIVGLFGVATGGSM